MSYVAERGAGDTNFASGVNAATLTLTSSMASVGNTLILAAGCSAAMAITGVTDSRGNTWSVDVIRTTNRTVFIASCLQDVGQLLSGDTVTVQATGSGSRIDYWLQEFTGQNVFDVGTSNGSTSGTSLSTGTTGATGAATEFAIAVFMANKSGGSVAWTWTRDTNYTDFTTTKEPAANNTYSAKAQYRLLSAVGTQSSTDTVSSSTNAWGAAIATYKVSSGSTYSDAATVSSISSVVSSEVYTPAGGSAYTESATPSSVTSVSGIETIAEVAPTTPLLTHFSGSDESPLNENSYWSQTPVSTQSADLLKRSSSQAAAAATNARQPWLGTFNADQEAYATVTVLPPSGQGMGVLCRITNPNTSSAAAYMGFYHTGTGFRLFKLTNGATFTQLGTTAAVSMVAGDKIWINATGTTITLYHYTGGAWVQRVQVNDSTITGSGQIGLEIDDLTTRVDDFGGGSLVPTAFPTTHVLDPFSSDDSYKWTSIQGDSSKPQISSGQYINNSGALERAIFTGTFAADQEAFITLGMDSIEHDLFVRYDLATNTGYLAEYDPLNLQYDIYQVTGVGGFSLIDTISTGRPLNGYNPTFVPPSGTIINVLTSYGTSDTQVRAAVAAAASSGSILYFPAATYTLTSTLTLNGIKAYGDGDTTILSMTDRANSAIILTGSGPSLMNLKVTCPSYAGTRLTTNESSLVLINGATNFNVSYVTCDGAASVGIFNYGGAGTSSAYSTIVYNTVVNTLADGIHNTNGAAYVEVGWNNVSITGDDLISVVSYQTNATISHDIYIHNNIVTDESYGRGITVVGGNSCVIENNYIDGTYGAGIYIASESAIPTYGVTGATITGNYIRNPAQVIHNESILIYGGETSFPVTGVTGHSNNTDPNKTAISFTGTQSGNTATAASGLSVLLGPTTGDVISFRAQGSVLSILLNGTSVGSVPDTLYNRGGQIGVGLYSGGTIDSFGGGDAPYYDISTVSSSSSVSGTDAYTPGSTGTAYTEAGTISSKSAVSSTENAGFVDTTSAASKSTLSSAEIAAFGDANTIGSSSSVSGSEVKASLDASTVSGITTPSSNDVISAVESATAASVTSIAVAESAQLVESGAIAGVTSLSSVEAHVITDSSTVISQSSVISSDVSGLVDAAVVSGITSLLSSEARVLADLGTIPSTTAISSADQAAYLDSANLASATSLSTTEGRFLTDSAAIATVSSLVYTEISTFADIATINGTTSVGTVEVREITDVATISSVTSVSGTEQASYVDSASISATTSVAVSEVHEITDSSSISSSTSIGNVEQAAYVDALSISSLTRVSTVELHQITDSGTVSSASTYSGADIAAYTDLANPTSTTSLLSVELHTISDTFTVSGSSAVTSVEVASFVDTSLVSTMTSLSQTELREISDSSVIASISMFSVTDQASYVDSSIASGLTSIQSVDFQSGVSVDDNTFSSTTTLTSTELSAYVDSGLISTSGTISTVELANLVDSSTVRSSSSIATIDVEVPVDSNTFSSVTVPTSTEVAAYVETGLFSTTTTISSSDFRSSTYIDSGSISSTTSISTTENAAYVDAASITGSSIVSSVSELPVYVDNGIFDSNTTIVGTELASYIDSSVVENQSIVVSGNVDIAAYTDANQFNGLTTISSSEVVAAIDDDTVSGESSVTPVDVSSFVDSDTATTNSAFASTEQFLTPGFDASTLSTETSLSQTVDILSAVDSGAFSTESSFTSIDISSFVDSDVLSSDSSVSSVDTYNTGSVDSSSISTVSELTATIDVAAYDDSATVVSFSTFGGFDTMPGNGIDAATSETTSSLLPVEVFEGKDAASFSSSTTINITDVVIHLDVDVPTTLTTAFSTETTDFSDSGKLLTNTEITYVESFPVSFDFDTISTVTSVSGSEGLFILGAFALVGSVRLRWEASAVIGRLTTTIMRKYEASAMLGRMAANTRKRWLSVWKG